MNSMVELAQFLLDNKRYDELRTILKKEIMVERQKSFEEYIIQGTKAPDGVFNRCLCGSVNGEQAFTNYHSFYLMKKEFRVSSSLVRKNNYSNGIMKPSCASEEELVKILLKIEKLVDGVEKVSIYPKTIGDNTLTVSSSINTATFNAWYIKQAYNMLGEYDTEFSLANKSSILLAEGEYGKAYVLGLNKVADIEVRTFNIE